MAGKNIKLKDGTGAEIDYTGVPKIKIPAADGGSDVIFQLPPTMQEKSVSITSNGTTDVIPDSGYDGLSKVTIATNVPSSGGKEEEAITVPLDMANGDQIVTPSEGKTLSQVTITKPDDLSPSRVVLGSNIGGVAGNYFAPEIWVLNEEIKVPAQALTFTDLAFLTYATNKIDTNDPFPIQTMLRVAPTGKVAIASRDAAGNTAYIKRPTAMSSGNYTDTNGWYGESAHPQIGRIMVFLQPTRARSVGSWLQQNAVLYGGDTVITHKKSLFELGDIDFDKVLDVTANGAYSIKPNAPYSTFGSATVNVNVPVPAVQDTKALTITSNGTVSVTPDAPYDALKKVDVTVDVASSGNVDAYKAAIYQYGDPAGDGCAIRTVWPASGIRLDLWTKASGAWSLMDENYWELWKTAIVQHLTSATLNDFATDLMTNLTSEFAAVFEGGTKASFMDLEHVCTIPAIADSDPKTLAGLLAVLARSLDELQQGWLYDDFMYPPDYSFVFPESAINAVFSPAGGDTVSIPFIMRPVVADGGTRMTGYNVQTPSGAMATYETGFKSFANAEGGNPLAVGYCNTIPAYGITSELVAVIITNDESNFNVAWYSYGGQTLVNAVLRQFLAGLWTSDMGDVTLTEGWNMTAVQAGTPQTANNLTESIVQGQLATVFPSGIPAKFVSAYLAEMDDYEKSVFLPVTTPTYKYVGKKSLQVNITLAIPEDTT